MKKSSRKKAPKTADEASLSFTVAPMLPSLQQVAVSPRAARFLALALAIATFLFGAWTFDAKLSLSGDNTEFITLARSVAQGTGLTHINTPNPAPATKYPPGFPLLLAPFEWLFPGSWEPMKWFVLVLFSMAMPIFFYLLRLSLGTWPSLMAALVCLTLPLLQDYAHQVMSEIPYLAFSLAALYLLQRANGDPAVRGNRWFYAAFVFTMAAYYVRSVGIVLIAAAVLTFLFRRERNKALVFFGGSVLIWLPWTLRNNAVGSGSVYLKQLIQVNPYFPDQGLLDLGQLIGRVLTNLSIYLFQILPSVPIYPERLQDGPGLLHPLGIVVTVALVYAGIQAYRNRRDLLLFFYTVLFIGSVLLWYWNGDRFLIPILPVLLYFVVRGVQDLLDLAASRGIRGSIPTVVVAVLVIATLVHNAGGIQKLAAQARADYYPNWGNYYRAGLWLRENTPDTSVVACRKGYWMYVVSGRSCVLYAFDEPDKVIEELEQDQVDFVIVEQLGFRHTGDYLVPAIQKYNEQFDVVWRAPNPDTWVLKFKSSI